MKDKNLDQTNEKEIAREAEREAQRDYYRGEGYDPDTIEEFILHDERSQTL